MKNNQVKVNDGLGFLVETPDASGNIMFQEGTEYRNIGINRHDLKRIYKQIQQTEPPKKFGRKVITDSVWTYDEDGDRYAEISVSLNNKTVSFGCQKIPLENAFKAFKVLGKVVGN